MKVEELIEKIKNSSHSKVKLAAVDIDGVLRGKYIHKTKFLEVIEKSFGFCDVIFGWDSNDECYENNEITGWHTGYPDAQAKIDGTTFREIPWENNLPFFIVDFSADKKYSDTVCPRSLLKKIVNECTQLGFSARYSFEFEWFNFKNHPTETHQHNFQNLVPISPGKFGYSVLRTTLNNPYFTDLFDLLEKFDIELEGLHTETGPGVFEAAIRFDHILRAADKAVLFKSAVKEIAYKHDFMATFMAKWNSKLPGCGGHIHQSLWNDNGDKNLFFDENGKYRMSELMESFIAGQLFCLPEILPMFAPNINSYKRIGHGDWAPSTVTWGIDNRTAAIRVIAGNNASTRLEMRVPGADANPYLASAASLASGLYGIKNKLKLTSNPVVGNAYITSVENRLSDNLFEATQKMAGSEIAKQLFGSTFVNHFTKTRMWEWKQFLNGVTDWELKRYFEII